MAIRASIIQSCWSSVKCAIPTWKFKLSRKKPNLICHMAGCTVLISYSDRTWLWVRDWYSILIYITKKLFKGFNLSVEAFGIRGEWRPFIKTIIIWQSTFRLPTFFVVFMSSTVNLQYIIMFFSYLGRMA